MNQIPEKGFHFQESNHRYYFNGKPMTGVTTILGVIAKPALIQWAANMAVDFVEEQVRDVVKTEGIDRLGDEWANILTDAKKAHLRKRDKAAESGTDVHSICEEIIKDVIENSDGFILTGRNSNEQVNHFIQWAIKHKVKFLASEKKVYSEKHFIAGTYDFKCEMNSKTYIGDIKTTSGIYDRTPFAQTAAYEMMEKEMKEQKIDGRLIINLKKTGKFDEEKDVYTSYDYETDIELFMSALSIYRILKNY